MELASLFWNASVEEIEKGYIFNPDSEDFICLVCGKRFRKGIIYPAGDILYEAERAIVDHISSEHGSVFDYLLNMHRRYTGLTDLQKKIMKLFREGRSDKEIARQLGMGNTSTVRNHRFKLRERKKQAKVFLALMNLLEQEPVTEVKEDEFVDIPRGAKMVDERFAITEQERKKIISNYFDQDGTGKLSTIPRREKRKIVVLQHIVRRFDPGRQYTEKEINEILKQVHPDFVALRRFLIDYGFMEREADGSAYWVKL